VPSHSQGVTNPPSPAMLARALVLCDALAHDVRDIVVSPQIAEMIHEPGLARLCVREVLSAMVAHRKIACLYSTGSVGKDELCGHCTR
jgi:hypothetical protein